MVDGLAELIVAGAMTGITETMVVGQLETVRVVGLVMVKVWEPKTVVAGVGQKVVKTSVT